MDNPIFNELENLYHFLHGAHLASNDENASATFHQACHKLQDILNTMKTKKITVPVHQHRTCFELDPKEDYEGRN